jgi:hypothetical protein
LRVDRVHSKFVGLVNLYFLFGTTPGCPRIEIL